MSSCDDSIEVRSRLAAAAALFNGIGSNTTVTVRVVAVSVISESSQLAGTGSIGRAAIR